MDRQSRTTGGPAKPRRKRERTAPLPTLRRRVIYLIAAGVWLSGALWLICHYFLPVQDSFGFETVNPLERWWKTLHAAFGFWAVWMFGNLWLHHIKLGWTVKARWISGGGLFLLVCWLIATGYLLYYLTGKTARAWTSLLHWIPGLAAIALFLLHLSFKWIRREEPRRREAG